MNQMYAITREGGYVLLGDPTASLVESGFLVRAEALMKAEMVLNGLELRWDDGHTSKSWMDPVKVFPGCTFTAFLTVEVKDQMVGPILKTVAW